MSVRRPALAVYAASLALAAYGGAAGLVTGSLKLSSELEGRLPFDSPTFGAIALCVLVGLPATALMVMAWRGHPLTLHAAALDGVLLMGWIVVELSFLREVSFLHALYVGYGAGLLFWGRSAIPELLARIRLPAG